MLPSWYSTALSSSAAISAFVIQVGNLGLPVGHLKDAAPSGVLLRQPPGGQLLLGPDDERSSPQPQEQRIRPVETLDRALPVTREPQQPT